MTLDPKSLSSEERAIVEEMVTRDQMFWAQSEFANAFMMNKAEHWQRSYDCAFARILARRALFGNPASEPAKVRMTEELSEIISAAWLWSCEPSADRSAIRDAIDIVKAQAAEAGKVREPPVADIQWALNIAASKAVTMSALEACQRIKKFLAELDVAEGKGEGRG